MFFKSIYYYRFYTLAVFFLSILTDHLIHEGLANYIPLYFTFLSALSLLGLIVQLKLVTDCGLDKSCFKLHIIRLNADHRINPLLLTHWHSERPKQAWLFCWYFPHKSVFIKNIWMRNVYQNSTNNSPSNILWEFALFQSYFQKFENSRRYFPGELWVWMG